MSKHSLDDCISYAQDQNVIGTDTAYYASRRLWKKGSGGEAGFMKTLCYASLEQCDSVLYAARHYHNQLEDAALSLEKYGRCKMSSARMKKTTPPSKLRRGQ